METKKKETLNLYQKLLEIEKMCGALRKEKAAYGFKYVEESMIQAVVTAGMQKYGVMLIHNIVPGTFNVMPHTYEKYDKMSKTNKSVTEFVVSAETRYTWINVDDPEDKIEGTYAMIGMQDDPSMAFGSAETYCNRYYLLKTLQIATTEDDPDNWRSKQREAADRESKEEEMLLKNKVKEVVSAGTNLIKGFGVAKEDMIAIVAKHNKGNGNPSSISSVEIGDLILEDFKKITSEKNEKEKENNK